VSRKGHTRHVAAMLVTRPEPTRIAVCRYDNRDSSRHPLGCERSRCSLGHDQVNFRAHEFRASRAVRGRVFCHSSRTTICRTHSFEIPTASPIAPSVVPASVPSQSPCHDRLRAQSPAATSGSLYSRRGCALSRVPQPVKDALGSMQCGTSITAQSQCGSRSLPPLNGP
jgi:hypothetical protein